jgi:hypothetical protein
MDRSRGDSWREKLAGTPACRSASELKVKVPSRLDSCSNVVASCRSSEVSLSRCRLLALNQESWLLKLAFVLVERDASDWLPPKASCCSPLDPSSKLEFTSTRPEGSARNGDECVRDWAAPMDVSLRMPNP